MTAFEKILARYGSEVMVYTDKEDAGVGARALMQPIRDKDRLDAASPLGWGRNERWLYLGQPEVSVDVGPEGFLRWGGMEFSVFSARKVCLGRESCHWCGILERREENL